MHPHKLVQVLREAGSVERCHTLPHHRTYSVGKHSFDAVNMYLVLCPEPSFRVVKAILWHDVPERWTGDVPAVAKWTDAALHEGLERIERTIFERLGMEFMNSLTEDERRWLDAVDKLELMVWCREEVAMGNMAANAILGNLVSWFSRKFSSGELPVEVSQFMAEHDISRTPDQIPK